MSVEWSVVLLREGPALSGREYTRQAVADVVAQTEGLHAYADHTLLGTPTGAVRSVRDLVGHYTGGYLHDDRGVAEARARLRLISHAQYIEDLARMSLAGSVARQPTDATDVAALARGPFVGLSIDAVARLGQGGRRVVGIQRLIACDVVTRPSAGGRFIAAPASHVQRATEAMDDVPEMPDWMVEAVQQGLDWVDQGKGGDGLRPQTIADARRMARGYMWRDKAIRMRAWLARHAGDLDAPGAMPGHPDFPTPGVVASALWGAGTKRRSALAMEWLDRWIAAATEEEMS